jgi:hypothetical protein
MNQHDVQAVLGGPGKRTGERTKGYRLSWIADGVRVDAVFYETDWTEVLSRASLTDLFSDQTTELPKETPGVWDRLRAWLGW